jgi:hypothetical protein
VTHFLVYDGRANGKEAGEVLALSHHVVFLMSSLVPGAQRSLTKVTQL